MLPRRYAGPADLRRMQAAVGAAFGFTGLHIGDVAWLSRQHTHRELSRHVRLWETAAGEVAAWTYWRDSGGFNAFVGPDQAGPGLCEALLEVVEADSRAVGGIDRSSLYTYGVDPARSASDASLAAVLVRHGFEPSSEPAAILARDLDNLPAAVPPAGYRLDAVRTSREVAGRVAAYRSAFSSEDLTVVKYERIRRRWPYRADLDRIAVSPAGDVAAFCTGWLDVEHACGLLEPVGTIPDRRRMGLAASVCLDALHRLRAAGARRAIVGYSSTPAFALYSGLGFRHWAMDTTYRMAIAQP